MATKFVPVALANIDEAAFLPACEGEFADLQRKMVAHVEDMPDSEVKVTGELVIKVKVVFEKSAYRIITDVQNNPPKKKLSTITTAMAEVSPEDGEMCLFARASGTSKDHPKQQILCDETGGKV